MTKLKQFAGNSMAALNRMIDVLRAHPRFQDAIRHMLDGADKLYTSNRLLGRVINDRGRFVGGMIALYLYSCPASEEDELGFTVSRFQAFCVEQNLCSFGRARALLTLMCLSGHLVPSLKLSDRRERRLCPTPQLIELQRRRFQYQLEALAFLLSEDDKNVVVDLLPRFTPAFISQLGKHYIDGFRLLRYAPELTRLAESNGGLLVILQLFLLASNGMPPDGEVAVPVSISALSKRYGISRAHVRAVLADAETMKLVRRDGEDGTIVVLPLLNTAVQNFCAALFGLLLHCAANAAEEVEGCI
jgi:hypothetical protein